MTKFFALLTAYNALKIAGNVLGAGHNLWFAVLSIPRKKKEKNHYLINLLLFTDLATWEFVMKHSV